MTRGFTGHEHDDELGLVNARGRVYDPTLRRFLTPDPIVGAPLFSQSYNRYSYVWNSPLNLSDPSGFDPVGPDCSWCGPWDGGGGAGGFSPGEYLPPDYGSDVGRGGGGGGGGHGGGGGAGTVFSPDASYMHGPESPTPVPTSSDASGWHRPTSAAEDPYARYGIAHDYGRDYAEAQASARFWHQVGVVLDESGASAFGGGVLVAAGGAVIVLSGPVGWGAGVVATLMIAGGTASAGIGAEQILLNATNTGTNELRAEMAAGASFARGISSPAVLVCGTVGAGLGGEEGLATGMAVGRGVEAIVALVPSRMWVGARPTFLNRGDSVPGHAVGTVMRSGRVYVLAGGKPILVGRYDFVVQGGKIRIGKGHYALSGGNPVEYAGEIAFGEGGTLVEWTNASGHFRPSAAFAGNAGLPMNLFRPVPFPAMVGIPQIPVYRSP